MQAGYLVLSSVRIALRSTPSPLPWIKTILCPFLRRTAFMASLNFSIWYLRIAVLSIPAVVSSNADACRSTSRIPVEEVFIRAFSSTSSFFPLETSTHLPLMNAFAPSFLPDELFPAPPAAEVAASPWNFSLRACLSLSSSSFWSSGSSFTFSFTKVMM